MLAQLAKRGGETPSTLHMDKRILTDASYLIMSYKEVLDKNTSHIPNNTNTATDKQEHHTDRENIKRQFSRGEHLYLSLF